MTESDASPVIDKGAFDTGCAKEEMELNSFLTNSKEDNASSVNIIWAFFYMCECAKFSQERRWNKIDTDLY